MEAMRVEWLTKEDAAKALGIKPRSVLAMADREKLRWKWAVDSKTNQRVKLVHAGDVEYARHARENPEQPVQGEQPVDTVQPKLPVEVATLAAHIELARRAYHLLAPPPPKPWMTIDEAAEYTHLSRVCLLRLIRKGILPAVEDEPLKAEGEKRAPEPRGPRCIPGRTAGCAIRRWYAECTPCRPYTPGYSVKGELQFE
jgi:hypothetical protein